MRLSFALLSLFLTLASAYGQTAVDPNNTRSQAEGTIAINPTNPNNLVGTVITQAEGTPNYIETYYSTDAGQNWTRNGVVSGDHTAGDPFVTFDPDGVAYLVYQHFYDGDLVVHRSSDAGANWGNPTIIDYPAEKIDRPWIATNPVRNTNGYFDIYIAHHYEYDDPVDGTRYSIRINRSTDGGITFSPSDTYDTSTGFGAHGASIAFGPNGAKVVAYAEYRPGPLAVEKIVIKPSGYSISTTQIGEQGTGGDNHYYVKGRLVLADSYPRIACDPNSSSVYVVWSGKANGADVLMARSTNAGSSWVTSVVDGSAGDQWMPAISVMENGVVSIQYYSSADNTTGPITVKSKYSTDGGANFIDGPSSSFTIPASGKTFLGDYNGLASWFGKALGFFTQYDGSKPALYFRSIPVDDPPRQGYSKVVLDQRDEQNQSFEKIGRWNSGAFSNYAAGQTYFLQHGQQIIRAKQQFKPGTTTKYHHWDDLPDVMNHKQFTVTGSQTITGRFLGAANGPTIMKVFLDYPTIQDSIEFRDPWFIDSVDASHGNNPMNRGMTNTIYHKRVSPFTPGTGTSYMGVFLDQDLQNPAYYMVRGPLVQPNINNFDWNFLGWTTTGSTQVTQPASAESPVIFGTGGDTVKARYKAHLGSSLLNATSTNSQRKTVRDVGLPQYLCYESAGEVWFSGLSDEVNWDPETRVSDGTGGFGAPSLAAGGLQVLAMKSDASGGGSTNDPPTQYLIYRKYNGSGYNLYVREKNAAWQNPVQVNTTSIGSGINTAPVIARTNRTWQIGGNWTRPTLVMVWEGTSGLKKRTVVASTSGGWEWGGVEGQLTGTGFHNPSLSTPYLDGGSAQPDVFITYDDGKNVYMQSDLQPEQYIWQTFGTFSGKSQVAADTRDPSKQNVNIVWENLSAIVGQEEEEPQGPRDIQQQSSVMHRRKLGSYLDWATEFRSYYPGEHYYHPTIALLDDGSARWAWNNGQDCFKARGGGSSWELVDYQPYTVYPTLPANGTGGLLTQANYLSMSYGGTPYRIEQRSQGDAPPQVSETYSRRVAAGVQPVLRTEVDGPLGNEIKRPMMSIELQKVLLKLEDGSVMPVEFAEATADTSARWEMLRTRPIRLSASIDSVLVAGVVQTDSTHRLGGVLRITFDLIDNQTGKLISKLGTERMFTRDTICVLKIRHRLKSFSGREVVIRPSIAGLNNTNMRFELVHVHTLKQDTVRQSRPLLSKGNSLQASSLVPTTFAMHNSYPNPFNPSTTIKFDLPEDANVSLAIYDVLGRNVVELVNSFRQAGYHSATWNAKDVASGVYFARFTATDANGNLKLNTVSKLALTK